MSKFSTSILTPYSIFRHDYLPEVTKSPETCKIFTQWSRQISLTVSHFAWENSPTTLPIYRQSTVQPAVYNIPA